MKVSVITATLGFDERFCRMLESLRQQTYPNIEHVVVSAQHNAQLSDYLNQRGLKDTKVYHQEPSGLYSALNLGLSKATGDIIFFLHSDDQLLDDKCFSIIQPYFTSGIDIVLGSIRFSGHLDGSLFVRHSFRVGTFNPHAICWGLMPPHTGLFVRSDLFSRIGVFDVEYKIAGDYDWMLRAFLEPSTTFNYADEIFVIEQSVGGLSTRGWESLKIAVIEDFRALNAHFGFWRSILITILKRVRKLSQFRIVRSKTGL